MDDIARLISLQEEKRLLLLEAEELTRVMSIEQADRVAQAFTRRGELFESCKLLDRQTAALVGDDEQMQAILTARCSPAQLPQDRQKLFRTCLAVRAAANRIRSEDSAVLVHISDERARLQEKIEQLNTSGQAVAGSYKKSVQTGVPGPRAGKGGRIL